MENIEKEIMIDTNHPSLPKIKSVNHPGITVVHG